MMKEQVVNNQTYTSKQPVEKNKKTGKTEVKG
jgi:hypothetical protein